MENKEEIREKLIAVNKGGLKLRAVEEGSGVPIASLKQFISICSMGRQKIKALGDYLDSVNIGTERPVPIMDPDDSTRYLIGQLQSVIQMLQSPVLSRDDKVESFVLRVKDLLRAAKSIKTANDKPGHSGDETID